MTADTVNWEAAARRLRQQRSLLYDEAYPGDVDEEALRRAFGYRAADQAPDGERALPYEHLTGGLGLVTRAQADWVRDTHTIVDRMNREAAEQQVKEVRVELARVYREAGKDLAELIRARCNDRTVPSKYRREGAGWAADLIDPTVPKDAYGNTITREADTE